MSFRTNVRNLPHTLLRNQTKKFKKYTNHFPTPNITFALTANPVCRAYRRLGSNGVLPGRAGPGVKFGVNHAHSRPINRAMFGGSTGVRAHANPLETQRHPENSVKNTHRRRSLKFLRSPIVIRVTAPVRWYGSGSTLDDPRRASAR
jgi:hypothetical protein